ncbi:YggS family pyridoxal phosphate-dependent enzyme [Clostridium sp. cel8]|uniref:YggS family pyridoxal phosphate-dependent enzyme n=1 Tax=unclassified Clostridium TaxID=2614128 RepID=UPI0015F69DD9|nr:YggS family pyridoxal phosphate-dependent enzyme [Clostridium sp. cel8]MBA5850650.1 YggS family pyridoxal phosphate-dependent enzyme [Clostridium sp. cel8]
MSIKENIDNIVKNLKDNVTLLAVSKTKPIEDIKEAYDFGIRDFGENKVQELIKKQPELPNDIRWHLIGHLQRNKVKYIVGKVYLIQSLDSVRLLNEIEKRYSSKNLIANTLIQINIGEEESKTGIYLRDLDNLIEACEKCHNVKVKGIMAVIPKGNEESSRYYFKKLNSIFNDLKKRDFKNIKMDILSMGMTHDYNIAIQEGSNLVRIGEGIFGKRNYSTLK